MTFPALLPATIEVFKTDIGSARQGEHVVRALQRHFPTLRATLDLEDCDRVLRVVSLGSNSPICWAQVQEFVEDLGIAIEALPD
jgi:hypothetical protein